MSFLFNHYLVVVESDIVWGTYFVFAPKNGKKKMLIVRFDFGTFVKKLAVKVYASRNWL